MDENMNITEQPTPAENMGGTEAQGKNGKPRMFTQEEVNGFVQDRINRMKGKIEKDSKAQYDQKFAELQAREMKLLVREKLDERGMPRDLADIITCADEKDITAKLDALERIYGGTAAKEQNQSGFRQVGVGQSDYEGPDLIREAMGLKKG